MRLLNNQIKVLIPLLLFLIMVGFLWKGLSRNPHKVYSPFINKPVPTFSAESLQNPQQTLSNKAFQGHISLLNVFASWCVSCQAEHPILMDIYNSHLVNIYGLNYKDQRSDAEHYLNSYGDPYAAVFYDPTGIIAINLGVYGTPETFVIDQKGIVRDKIVGPISPEEWKNKLKPEILSLEKGQP